MNSPRGSKSPWLVLAIPATRDAREVKRAYAKKLKVTRPEDDPEAFQELRRAYEIALRWAENAAQNPVLEPTFDMEDEVEDSAFDESVEEASEQVLDVAGFELVIPEGVLPVAPVAKGEPEVWSASGFELAARVRKRLARDGAEAAADELEHILGSADHENLDAAADLEQELIHILARFEPFPFALAELADTHHGWTRALRQRPDGSARQYVMQRIRARRLLLELRQQAKRDIDNVRAEAKLALLSPWEAYKHERIAFMNNRRAAIRVMLRDAERYVPGFTKWELDPRVWAFWSAELAKPRLQAWHLGVGIMFGLVVAVVSVMFGAFASAGPYQLPLAWGSISFALTGLFWGVDRVTSGVAAGRTRDPVVLALDYLHHLFHDFGPYGRLAFVSVWLLISLSPLEPLSWLATAAGLLSMGQEMGFKRIPAILCAAGAFRAFSAHALHDWFQLTVARDEALVAWCVVPFLLWSACDALFAHIDVQDSFGRELITTGWASSGTAALVLLAFACVASGESGGKLITVFFSVAIGSAAALFATSHYGGLTDKRSWAPSRA